MPSLTSRGAGMVEEPEPYGWLRQSYTNKSPALLSDVCRQRARPNHRRSGELDGYQEDDPHTATVPTEDCMKPRVTLRKALEDPTAVRDVKDHVLPRGRSAPSSGEGRSPAPL